MYYYIVSTMLDTIYQLYIVKPVLDIKFRPFLYIKKIYLFNPDKLKFYNKI